MDKAPEWDAYSAVSPQFRVEQFRRAHAGEWERPGVVDSLRFTMRELTELDDVLLRLGYTASPKKQYVRNSDDPKDLKFQATLELGQTFMMLCSLATELQIGLNHALTVALVHQSDKLEGKRESEQ